MTGRTDGNKRVVFPFEDILAQQSHFTKDSLTLFDKHITTIINKREQLQQKEQVETVEESSSVRSPSTEMDATTMVGRYVIVKITQAYSPTLRGIGVTYSSISNFSYLQNLLTTLK